VTVFEKQKWRGMAWRVKYVTGSAWREHVPAVWMQASSSRYDVVSPTPLRVLTLIDAAKMTDDTDF
jgi:hypothetical protein